MSTPGIPEKRKHTRRLVPFSITNFEKPQQRTPIERKSFKRNSLHYKKITRINKTKNMFFLTVTEKEKLLESSIKDYVERLKKMVYIKEKNIDETKTEQISDFEEINDKINYSKSDKKISSKRLNDSEKNIVTLIRNKNKYFSISTNDLIRLKFNLNVTKTEEKIKYIKNCTYIINVLLVPFTKHKDHPYETLEELEYILKKQKRTLYDIIYLQHFLTIYDLIPKVFENAVKVNQNELLFHMAKCLNLHEYDKNELVFRYGDYSNKIFLIIVGSCNVILPKQVIIRVNFLQYLDYLYLLKSIKEFGLAKKIIEMNDCTFHNNQYIIKIKTEIEKQEKWKKKKNDKRFKKSIILRDQIFKNKNNNNNFAEINLGIDNKELGDFIIDEEIINTRDYINRAKPPTGNETQYNNIPEKILKQINNPDNISDCSNNDQLDLEKEFPIIFYEYGIIAKMKDYSLFGERSLDNTKLKLRTASIICTKDSKICYLDIYNYSKSIKYFQEFIKIQNIMLLKQVPFLSKIDYETFKNKYYNYFKLIDYKIGDIIFGQNEMAKYIYLIKSGEFELIMKCSLNFINYLLENKFNEKDSFLPNNIKNENNKEILFNLLLKDKEIINWRVLSVHPKDVMGLNEILFDDKFFLSAKCLTFNAEVYQIDRYVFYNQIVNDKEINPFFLEYEKNKNNLIFDRLKNMREIFFEQKYKNLTYKNKNLIHKNNENIKVNTLFDNKNLNTCNNLQHFNRNRNIKGKKVKEKCSFANYIFNSDYAIKTRKKLDYRNYINPFVHCKSKNKSCKNQKNSVKKDKKFMNQTHNYFHLKGDFHIRGKIIQNAVIKKNAIVNTTNTNLNTNTTSYINTMANISNNKSINKSFNKKLKKKINRNNDKLYSANTSSFDIDIPKIEDIRNLKYTPYSHNIKHYMFMLKNKEKIFNKNKIFFQTQENSDNVFIRRILGKNNKENYMNLNTNNFQKYINEVRSIKIGKKPKINVFSSIMFSLCDLDKSYNDYNKLSLSKVIRPNKYTHIFNNYECLILDKIVSNKENENKTDNKIKNKKEIIKDLKSNSVKNKIPSNIRQRLELKKNKEYDYSKLLFLIK